MPDSPDYAAYLPGSARFALKDLGELAARMGSADKYDRRGEVIWMDDGGHGIGMYNRSVTGTGGEIYAHVEKTYHGGYCIILKGGSDGAGIAQITRSFSALSLGKTGIEVAYSIASSHTKNDIILSRFDGTNQHKGKIVIYGDTGQIDIQVTDGDHVTIDTIGSLINAYNIVILVKLVIDFDGDKYVRLMINQREYDLSSYGIYVSAAPDIAQQRMTINQYSRATFNDYIALNHVILTANEY